MSSIIAFLWSDLFYETNTSHPPALRRPAREPLCNFRVISSYPREKSIQWKTANHSQPYNCCRVGAKDATGAHWLVWRKKKKTTAVDSELKRTQRFLRSFFLLRSRWQHLTGQNVLIDPTSTLRSSTRTSRLGCGINSVWSVDSEGTRWITLSILFPWNEHYRSS